MHTQANSGVQAIKAHTVRLYVPWTRGGGVSIGGVRVGAALPCRTNKMTAYNAVRYSSYVKGN